LGVRSVAAEESRPGELVRVARTCSVRLLDILVEFDESLATRNQNML